MKMLTKLELSTITEYAEKKEQFEACRGKIIDRMNYIIRSIFEICGGKLDWWDLKNDDPEYRSSIIKPEINMFDDFVSFYAVGSLKNDCIVDKNGNGIFIREEFPKRWLWEDFEDEIKNGLAEVKRREELSKLHAQKKEKEKLEKQEQIKQQVLAKLTPEEIKALFNKKNKTYQR
jgi:hypothetical protein